MRVDAEYQDGVLRPSRPLSLRAGERVHLVVLRERNPARWDRARLSQIGHADVEVAEAGLAEWAAALDEIDRR